MSAAPPSESPTTVELGGGFVFVRRPDGQSAILVPHLQSAGVAGMMSTTNVNARDSQELRAWLSQWGFEDAMPLVQVNQVHGTTVVVADASADAATDADGIMSDARGVLLTVKAADCAPVWIADMASTRFALLHAGWRGVADGIIAAAIDVLAAQGSNAAELSVAVGPHLGSCCFEVGPEVAQRFGAIGEAVLPAQRLIVQRRRDDSCALDLSAAIHADLNDVGVRDEQVFVATACTRCHPEIFHSYRRNGAGGPLMAAVAARRA